LTKFDDKKAVKRVTHGLFCDEVAYKKWWLSAIHNQRKEGDIVKMAVVLWDIDEAVAKRKTLPRFWSGPIADTKEDFTKKVCVSSSLIKRVR
jgi:hypothetical protein